MPLKQIRHYYFSLLATTCAVALTACGPQLLHSPKDNSAYVTPMADYCPYLPSKSFSSAVTISGQAIYEYRQNGDGEVAGSHTLTPAIGSSNYSLSINSVSITSNCTSSCTSSQVVDSFVSSINENSAAGVSATKTLNVTGVPTLVLAPVSTANLMTLAQITGFTDSYAGDPRPIRFAEVRVNSADGTLVQCAETDSSGAFSFPVPANTGNYTVSITSRASNGQNTAYIMDSPSDNQFYKISGTVSSNGSPLPIAIVAPASFGSSLAGGAFNILDQILNAQTFLRTSTASCNIGASVNFYPDCNPVTSIPVVYTYWSPGVTPSIYLGSTGPISYYLNGKSQLYILGGENGDTRNSDMDQFDNSVIIHEYGHFIEDHFGQPNSPGGSHNGNAVIDPRLAWGEGWADFFQAAVTGNPVYRDTYGNTACVGGTPCHGISFNENLAPNTTDSSITYDDQPSANGGEGEGNFREFSVTRLLWGVIHGNSANGGAAVSKFSEIWTAVNGPAKGMIHLSDDFKSIGRLHKIQQAITGHSNWAPLVASEHQVADLSVYGAQITTAAGCSPTQLPMSITEQSTDDGSFVRSDQFRNNRFYVYNHPGGPFNLQATWSGSSVADLDLYVYNVGYVYGLSSYWAAYAQGSSAVANGSQRISTSLAPGTYIINVMAYTGYYTTQGIYPTSFNLTLNGAPACPTP